MRWFGDRKAVLRFATTNWSVVSRAADKESAVAREALAALCEAYWYPAYVFVRRWGHSPADAEDLTQAYFARFLEKEWFRQPSPDRGRFRTFLLASLKNFVRNEGARQRTAKRGGGKPLLSLDATTAEGRYLRDPGHSVTPEALFEQTWAREVIARAIARLQDEVSTGAGGRERFDRLKAQLTGAEESPAYRQLARDWGVSESAVRVSVHRLRKRLGRTLREEISATVADPADVGEELRYLLAALEG